MSTKLMKAIVFMGSVRDGRNVTRVEKFITSKLKEANYEVDVWDPKELNLPMLTQSLHLYPDPSKAPQQLREMDEKIRAADAFIVLTPEYNRQLPPALTNMIDYFSPVSYAYRASAIVCYSLGIGGQAAAAQARTLMVEMGAPPIPYILNIPHVHQSLDELGNVNNEYLHKSVSTWITQLNWFTNAFRNQRALGIPAAEGGAMSKTITITASGDVQES